MEVHFHRLQTTASQLFHKYILDNSSNQLNLDSYSRKQLIKKKDAFFSKHNKVVLYQLFCKVVDILTIQLSTDCFPRFLKSPYFSKWLLQQPPHCISQIIQNTTESVVRLARRDFYYCPIISPNEFLFVDFAVLKECWTVQFESQDKLSKLYTCSSNARLFNEEAEEWYFSKIEMVIPYNYEKLLLLNHLHHSISYEITSSISKDSSLNVPFNCSNVTWTIDIGNKPMSYFNVCVAKKFQRANQIVPERAVFVTKPTNEDKAVFFAHAFYKISEEITRIVQFQIIDLKKTDISRDEWVGWDIQKTQEERDAIIQKMNSFECRDENGILSHSYKQNSSL